MERIHVKSLILTCICACILITSFLAGCATRQVPDVATHYAQFTKLRTDIIPENLLETEGPVRELVWLNASRVFKDRESFDYYLEVHYQAMEETGFLDIPPGETLTITADDRKLVLEGIGSRNSQATERGIVMETALYPAYADQLRAIARAKKVVVEVAGRNGRVVREFAEPNFQKFRKFVAQFVEGEEG
jgi:hypothetical protein